MRTVPRRSPALVVLATLACFLGGPFLGLALTEVAGTSSFAAQAASSFAFLLSFFGGMLLWFGFAVVLLVPRFLWWAGRWRSMPPSAPCTGGLLWRLAHQGYLPFPEPQ